MKTSISRFLPEIFGVVLVLVCHRVLFSWTTNPRLRAALKVSAVVAGLGLTLNVPLVWKLLPAGHLFTWSRAIAIIWAIAVCGTTAALSVRTRRNLL